MVRSSTKNLLVWDLLPLLVAVPLEMRKRLWPFRLDRLNSRGTQDFAWLSWVALWKGTSGASLVLARGQLQWIGKRCVLGAALELVRGLLPLLTVAPPPPFWTA